MSNANIRASYWDDLKPNSQKVFKGHDYCELGEALFGRKAWHETLLACAFEQDAKILQSVLDEAYSHLAIDSEFGVGDTKTAKKITALLREFLKALSKAKHCHLSPVWAGMAKVTDDCELLKVATPLVGMMWS